MASFTRLFRKKPKGKYVLALDVGTRTAKAMVAYSDFEQETVTDLGIGRSPQKTGNVVGGKLTDVRGVIAACRLAIDQAQEMAGVKPQETIMGFSGSTVLMRTETFEFEREDPRTKIEVGELKSIVQTVHQRSLERIQENLSRKERQIGAVMVSADIVSFSIDGYRIINPLNFHGKRLKITVSNSYILNSDFSVICAIAEELGLKLKKVAYGPYAVAKAIGAADALSFNTLLVDVGGNITDVVLVKNGNIQHSGMFILGGHLFTKRLANKFQISEQSAEDLKLSYARNRLPAEDQRKVDALLSEDIDLWLSGVQCVLEDAAKEHLIPSRVLFYGGGSQLPGLVSSMNRLSRSEIPFSDKLQLDFVRLQHISNNTDRTRKLNEFQDMPLVGLAHMCLESVDAEDTANRYLSEII